MLLVLSKILQYIKALFNFANMSNKQRIHLFPQGTSNASAVKNTFLRDDPNSLHRIMWDSSAFLVVRVPGDPTSFLVPRGHQHSCVIYSCSCTYMLSKM